MHVILCTYCLQIGNLRLCGMLAVEVIMLEFVTIVVKVVCLTVF